MRKKRKKGKKDLKNEGEKSGRWGKKRERF
jgi:hypothetical protein